MNNKTESDWVCDICGQQCSQQYWENGEIVATRCAKHPYIPYPLKSNNYYNYKCPTCGGEYNTPAQGLPEGTYVHQSCPFCGREMKGL